MVHYNRFGNREKKKWRIACEIEIGCNAFSCRESTPNANRVIIGVEYTSTCSGTHTHSHWAMCCTLRSFVLIFFFFGFSQQNDSKQNNLDEKNNAVSCFFLDCHRLVLLSVIIVLVRKNRSQLNNNSNVKNEKKRKKTRTFCDKKTHIESYHEIASM